MDIEPFHLERWLDRYEPDAEIMLGESGIRSLSADRFDLDVGPLGYVIPTDGDPALREAIGDRYGRTAEEVVLTCGTQEANLLAVLATLDGGGHAVVVTPTYQSLRSLPAAVGSVTAVAAEPPAWELPVDAIGEAVTAETDLVVLANPANPTGRYHDRDRLRAVHETAADVDAYLLVDEVYRDLVPDPYPPAASMGASAVSTAGVSKAYGLAGARVGWVVAEPGLAAAVRRWKDYTTIAPPKLGHHVAGQALGEREAGILAANRELARTNRRLVADFVEAAGLGWLEPDTVVGFPTVPTGFDDAEGFCRSAFEAEGVLLAPGESFGHPERFRIGFGAETADVEAGLERLERHLGLA